jgi:hypothetical protein
MLSLQDKFRIQWLISGLYRPQTIDEQTFNEDFIKTCDQITTTYDSFMFIGDLNYDMIVSDKSSPLQNIKSSLNVFSSIVCGLYHRHSNSGPPFSSFGSSRNYGMNLCLEVYHWTNYPYFTTFRVTTIVKIQRGNPRFDSIFYNNAPVLERTFANSAKQNMFCWPPEWVRVEESWMCRRE